MPEPQVVSPQPKGRFEIPVLGETPAPAPEAPAATPVAKPESQNTANEAPAAPAEGETPKEITEVTPEQAAKREGRRFERKLDKAYRQAAEATARAELAEKQLEEARRAPPQAVKEPAAGEPTLAQFDFDPEKYAQAKADWAKKQAETEFKTKQQAEASKRYRETLVSSWEEKAESAMEKYEDFATVVGELTPDFPFTAAIMEAENGPDVAYYLGKHPKEAERIAKLPPLSQGREIGKLEAKLLSQPAEKPKAPSKAPAPITPLTGSAPVATDQPSEQDDLDSWMRKRNKQVRRR